MEIDKVLEVGGLSGLASVLHETAVEKGFWDKEVTVDFVLSKLALVHSEVSEILEAIRKDKGEKEIVIEIVDLLIRTLDVYAGMVNAGMVTTDLDDAFAEKASFNSGRPIRHGALA